MSRVRSFAPGESRPRAALALLGPAALACSFLLPNPEKEQTN
jgi:hypothetical protein